jgi:ABC-2 type transport system permease protein
VNALRLFGVFLRIGAMAELAYRANFWVQLVESVLSIGSALGAVAVVFARTDTLHGWRADELVVVVGVYFMVLGLVNFVVSPSLEKFTEAVRDGTLDFTLTKPADAQLLVSISQVEIWKLIDVVLGAGALAYGLRGLARDVSAVDALSFCVAMVAGGAIVYAFWLVLATFAFWLIRIENILMIFWMVYGAGRWPVGIYPDWLRWTLTLLVPVAFAVTVPAEAVTGRLDPSTLALASALAVASLLFSRAFWRFGLRHYAGASA